MKVVEFALAHLMRSKPEQLKNKFCFCYFYQFDDENVYCVIITWIEKGEYDGMFSRVEICPKNNFDSLNFEMRENGWTSE